MNKTLLLLLFIFSTQFTFSQTSFFQILLDSGKNAFKQQASAQAPDYNDALQLLTKAAMADPGSAEAHYFLGYAIDKMNADDGSKMNNVRRELTEKASEQFEKVIALQKNYIGERLALDPYSKISSIWGSLAQAYFTKGLPDSALWAFKQGKQRGGFIDPLLDYNRQILNSCEQNAILITNGDLITFPVSYLQAVEGFRTDITPVDANMLNVGWYTQYIKHKGLQMSLTDAEIDTMDYISWTATNITIHNPKNASQSVSWTLKPTYYDQYILKGDRMMLDIVRKNLFARSFYFTGGTDSTTDLYLGDYLVDDGLVDKLLLLQNDPTTKATIISNNLSSYNIDKLKADEIQRSSDAVYMLNGFRLTFLLNSKFLYSKGELAEAKKLFLMMKQKFDTAKLPYGSAYIENKVDELETLLKP